VTRDHEKEQRLAEVLRTRGLDDGEVAATLRKKRRRRALEYDLAETRAVPVDAGGGPLCTVEEVAARLKLHVKTVQRFIREGRLPARRVGRGYRLLRADVERFAGMAAMAEPPAARVTAIVDLPGVGEDAAKQWSRNMAAHVSGAAVSSRAAHVELVHDAQLAQLKILIVGTMAEIGAMLALVRLWWEQLPAEPG
jgi:excisionase family DNA binding protein